MLPLYDGGLMTARVRVGLFEGDIKSVKQESNELNGCEIQRRFEV